MAEQGAEDSHNEIVSICSVKAVKEQVGIITIFCLPERRKLSGSEWEPEFSEVDPHELEENDEFSNLAVDLGSDDSEKESKSVQNIWQDPSNLQEFDVDKENEFNADANA